MTTIIISGHLDEAWADWFDGMKFKYDGKDTVLSGMIKDDAHLHGILNRIRDLNLKLISVNTLDNDNNINELEKK